MKWKLPTKGAVPRWIITFHSKVDISDDQSCWDWTGTKDEEGYGLFKPRGKEWRVHRLAFTLWRRAIPEDADLVVHHSCSNRLCCNPAHLELMTPSQHSKHHHPKSTQAALTP